MTWAWTLRLKYDASQPRVPAGSSEGGQWTSGGGYARAIPYKNTPDSPTFRAWIAERGQKLPPEVFKAAREPGNVLFMVYQPDSGSLHIGEASSHADMMFKIAPKAGEYDKQMRSYLEMIDGELTVSAAWLHLGIGKLLRGSDWEAAFINEDHRAKVIDGFLKNWEKLGRALLKAGVPGDTKMRLRYIPEIDFGPTEEFIDRLEDWSKAFAGELVRCVSLIDLMSAERPEEGG